MRDAPGGATSPGVSGGGRRARWGPAPPCRHGASPQQGHARDQSDGLSAAPWSFHGLQKPLVLPQEVLQPAPAQCLLQRTGDVPAVLPCLLGAFWCRHRLARWPRSVPLPAPSPFLTAALALWEALAAPWVKEAETHGNFNPLWLPGSSPRPWLAVAARAGCQPSPAKVTALPCGAAAPAHSHSAQPPASLPSQGLLCIPATAFSEALLPFPDPLSDTSVLFSTKHSPAPQPRGKASAGHRQKDRIPFQAPQNPGTAPCARLTPTITCFCFSSRQHSCSGGAWK